MASVFFKLSWIYESSLRLRTLHEFMLPLEFYNFGWMIIFFVHA